MRFEHPLYLIGIALVLWLSMRIFFGRRIAHSAVRFFSKSGTVRFYEWAQRGLVITIGVVAVLFFARPLVPAKTTTMLMKTRDFALLMDFSFSMDEPFGGTVIIRGPFGTLYPASSGGDSKLAIAQRVAIAFAGERRDDRIGVVVFDNGTYVKQTLTRDHRGIIKWLLEKQETLSGGTFIAQAIIKTAAHMHERGGTPGTRAIILFSDGEDTDLLRDDEQRKIKTILQKYDIRLWWLRTVPPTKKDEWREDNIVLRKLSEGSGGATFTVTDEASVKLAFEQISSLESAPLRVTIPGNSESEFDNVLLAIAASAFAVLFIAKLLFDLT